MHEGPIIQFQPRQVVLPGDINTLCVQYLLQLERRGRASNTIKAYRIDLEQFAGFMAGRGALLLQTVTARLLEDFIDALIQGEGVSRRTAARKFEVVRGLFKFAIQRGILNSIANPVNDVTPISYTPLKVIAPAVAPLLRMIDSIPATHPGGIRDRAMFQLLFDSALRVGGLESLDLFNPDDPPQYTVWPSGKVFYRGKGGRTDMSCCDEETMEWLARWLKVRHHFERAGSPPSLFLSQRGGRISRAVLHNRIKLHGARAGMPKLHCHLLRHRRGGQVMDTMGLRAANALLAHKNLSTTADVYGHQAAERLHIKIRQQCPLRGEDSCA